MRLFNRSRKLTRADVINALVWAYNDYPAYAASKNTVALPALLAEFNRALGVSITTDVIRRVETDRHHGIL
jgi:hypothetical protein